MAGKRWQAFHMEDGSTHVIVGSGGARPGAGAKKKDSTEVVQLVSVYLSAGDKEYLMSWGVKPSDAARRLIDRARKMWPKGE